MRKIMLFFENYATFFKYAFQKNKKHKTISSCIYIINAAWYFLHLELLTCFDKHNLLVPFYCKSRINESPIL